MPPRLWLSPKRFTFSRCRKITAWLIVLSNGAVHRLHEPGDFPDLEELHEADEDGGILSAPPGSVADSSGKHSARDAPPDTTADQNGIPSALDPVMSDRDPLLGLGERWALDKRGHRYTIDEFCKGTHEVMERYAAVPTMTGPIDPDEAEAPCVPGASSRHALPPEDVVEFVESLPPIPEEDGHEEIEEMGVHTAPHFGTDPS